MPKILQFDNYLTFITNAMKTIAEVAHNIFSHIQVHKFGWKKFEHPKSILSTASKLPKMAIFG